MSRIDRVIKCTNRKERTAKTICMLLQRSYVVEGIDVSLEIWLHKIKPYMGFPRLVVIRGAFQNKVWEKLC